MSLYSRLISINEKQVLSTFSSSKIFILIPEKLSRIKVGEPKRSQSLEYQMQKVPPLPKQDQNNQQDYVPLVVSLGPYHHGKKEHQMAEDFKISTLEMFVADSGKDCMFFYTKVFEMVKDARNCYSEDSTCHYDDQTFAQMMLLDACFVINFVVEDTKNYTNFHVTPYGLGKLVTAVIFRDFFLLENQIPFGLLRMLICLRYGEKEGEEMINGFLNPTFKFEPNALPRSVDNLPMHLLDASWRTLVSASLTNQIAPVSACACKPTWMANVSTYCGNLFKNMFTKFSNKLRERGHKCGRGYKEKQVVRSFQFFHSASELKAKGIHLRPSLGNLSITSTKFKSSYFFARLEVPTCSVTNYSKEFFHNMIAYELCHCSDMDRVVTAHIEFMKLLIETPKDVKVVREKKILLNSLQNDEDVVKVYKAINTYGIGNAPILFQYVNEEIQAHYNNRAKIWLAELLYTYFRSPWTAIALLVATSLLVLTFLQTIYTIKATM